MMLHTTAAVIAVVAAVAHEFYAGVLFMRCSRLWAKVLCVLRQASSPTSRDFGILLSFGRLHEPWSRPQNRPYPDEVGVGGHGSGRTNKKVDFAWRKRPQSAQRTRDLCALSRRKELSYIVLYVFLLYQSPNHRRYQCLS